MKKCLTTALAVALSVTAVLADVTVTQTMTMEGPSAAMMQGAQLPRMTMRIKGRKSRTDIDMNGTTISSIADLDAGHVVLLNAANRTATVTSPATVAAGGAPIPMPKVDLSLKPTGKSQSIAGQSCDEHAFTMTLHMAEMMTQLPPEAAAAVKDVRMVMNGSFWVAKAAPGADEFAAFSKAAAQSKLLSSVMGAVPGMSGGIDKLIEAASTAPGLPYLTEMTMSLEGTGPMVEAMKAMGGMKMVQRIDSVSTAPLADDLFRIPEGYTIEKK